MARFIPHIPAHITELHQRFPVRFGSKRLYLSVVGRGTIQQVLVNGKEWNQHDAVSVFLPHDPMPPVATVQIVLEEAKPTQPPRPAIPVSAKAVLAEFARSVAPPSLTTLRERVSTLARLLQQLERAKLGERYEAAHAQLVLAQWLTVLKRMELQRAGTLARLPERSQLAADRSYVETLTRLCDGLERVLGGYAGARVPEMRRLYEMWQAVQGG